MDSQSPNQAPQVPSNLAVQQFSNSSPPPLPPAFKGETFKGNIKPFLYITLSIMILVSIFALSFLYFSKQNQPPPRIRAAVPTQIPSSSTAATEPPGNSTSQRFSNLPGGEADITATPQPSTLPTSSVYTPVPEDTKASSPQEAPKNAVRAIFDVIAENNAFTPKHLTAYVDQVVVIYFTAKDHDYNVTIPSLNLKKTIKQGQKSALEFQAQNFGEYVFECNESCNNSPEAKGLLFIKPL